MTRRQGLLAVDGTANLVLGVALMVFPAELMSLSGVPEAEPAFYPSLLGAVLLGIGLALFLEVGRWRAPVEGLGLGGAASINVCAGLALAAWLIFGSSSLPLRGGVLLWAVALALVGLSGAELLEELRDSGEAV